MTPRGRLHLTAEGRSGAGGGAELSPPGSAPPGVGSSPGGRGGQRSSRPEISGAGTERSARGRGPSPMARLRPGLTGGRAPPARPRGPLGGVGSPPTQPSPGPPVRQRSYFSFNSSWVGSEPGCGAVLS